MRLIDWSSGEPAENLAYDEALLDAVEDGHAPATLRFWESPTPFVVLGTAQVLKDEANEALCRDDGIPILRRCSAGGAVLQGPGSLNYVLALPYDAYPQVRGLHKSYCFILRTIVGALKRRGINASIEGISDIAVAGRKISGNAQKRRKRAMLHHGTLLHLEAHSLTLRHMDRCLREPAVRPDYRGARIHEDFLAVLPLTPDVLRSTLQTAFLAEDTGEGFTQWEHEHARQLVAEKYAQPAWTHRR